MSLTLRHRRRRDLLGLRQDGANAHQRRPRRESADQGESPFERQRRGSRAHDLECMAGL